MTGIAVVLLLQSSSAAAGTPGARGHRAESRLPGRAKGTLSPVREVRRLDLRRRLRALPRRLGALTGRRQRAQARERLRLHGRALIDLGVDREVARFALGFYDAVGRASELEVVLGSEEFIRSASDPATEHPSSFGTHSVEHASDVTSRVRPVLRDLDRSGLLVRRSPERLAFVEALALQIAALHDIGNGADGFSAAARAEHRQFAAQAVMSRRFDAAARSVERGPIGRYLAARADRLGGHSVDQVVREMLAGATLHDKVTREELRSSARLAERMRSDLARPLEVARDLGAPSKARTDSYEWLADRELFEDFRDAAALVVTAADAFRKRGRRLRDSSDAAIAIEKRGGAVVHFKHTRDGRVLPSRLRNNSPFAVGDAAIHFTRFERARLVVGLTSGRYGRRGEHNQEVAEAVGFQLQEILADTLERIAAARGSSKGLGIVLQRAPDERGSGFSEMVRDSLPAHYRSRVEIREAQKPGRRHQERVTRTRQRQAALYGSAVPLMASERGSVWRLMGRGGIPIEKVDSAASARVLRRARRLEVPPGTRVIERGVPTGYVYVLESGGADLVDDSGGRVRVARGVVLGQEAALTGSPLGSPVDVVVHGRGRISLVAIPAVDYAAHLSQAYHLPGDLIDLLGPP